MKDEDLLARSTKARGSRRDGTPRIDWSASAFSIGTTKGKNIVALKSYALQIRKKAALGARHDQRTLPHRTTQTWVRDFPGYSDACDALISTVLDFGAWQSNLQPNLCKLTLAAWQYSFDIADRRQHLLKNLSVWALRVDILKEIKAWIPGFEFRDGIRERPTIRPEDNVFDNRENTSSDHQMRLSVANDVRMQYEKGIADIERLVIKLGSIPVPQNPQDLEGSKTVPAVLDPISKSFLVLKKVC